MSNNKFESLLELLINEENDKAEALFHEIVVEKSRDIYENLADESTEDKVEETAEESKEDAKVDELQAAIGLSSSKSFPLNSNGLPMHFNESVGGDNFFGKS